MPPKGPGRSVGADPGKDMGKRTTLILDEKLVDEAMEATGARTKPEVVELALRELIRTRYREALRQDLGTFMSLMSDEELTKMRNADS